MIVWNDIEHLTKSYTNGIKKLDGLNENKKYNNNKIDFNKNKFHFNHSNDDFGLDERITIRPFHIKYDSSFKNLMSVKSTPSKTLGKHSLSSGTIEAINLTKKLIPNIDYSYTDPQYYEHKLKGKTTKDLILNELSKGKKFAKEYMERQNMGMEDVNSNIKPTYPSSSSPPPSPRSMHSEDKNETNSRSRRLLFGSKTKNGELHIGPPSLSKNTPSKIKGISEEDFTSTPSTPYIASGGGGGGHKSSDNDNGYEIETEDENEEYEVETPTEEDKKKARRKQQLAKNHQDRKAQRKLFTPMELDKMKLPELQAQAKHLGISIENEDSGKGKGRGSKKVKTMKQLINDIKTKQNEPQLRLKKGTENSLTPEFVYVENSNKNKK